MYALIITLFVVSLPLLSHERVLWRVKVPKRVSFFLWATSRGRFPTIDKLIRSGLFLVNWC